MSDNRKRSEKAVFRLSEPDKPMECACCRREACSIMEFERLGIAIPVCDRHQTKIGLELVTDSAKMIGYEDKPEDVAEFVEVELIF